MKSLATGSRHYRNHAIIWTLLSNSVECMISRHVDWFMMCTWVHIGPNFSLTKSWIEASMNSIYMMVFVYGPIFLRINVLRLSSKLIWKLFLRFVMASKLWGDVVSASPFYRWLTHNIVKYRAKRHEGNHLKFTQSIER